MMFLYRTIEGGLCSLSIATKCVCRHINLRFLYVGKMNSGKNQFKDSSPSGKMSSRFHSAAGDGQLHNSFNNNNSGKIFPEYSYDEEYPPLGKKAAFCFKVGQAGKRKVRINFVPDQKTENIVSSQLQNLTISNYASQVDESSAFTPFQNKGLGHARMKTSPSIQSYSKHGAGTKKFDSSEGSSNIKPFDICFSRRRNYNQQTLEVTRDGVLRPGMVLLKYYLSIREQIKIVRTCQELSSGPGGFYQPGYNDGAKLRLQMMCLGLNWDPQTRSYGKVRSIDGYEPPGIPHEFSQLVQRAITEARALIKKDSEASNVEDILPAMSPDICIVNFYKTSGRLGLHKDRDESQDSLNKGLPVVSFSVGDSAEFLYGDERDMEKAEKVLLESGDVLIFGGESRHIFHGVSSIISKSAPWVLLENTMLRPGRLNLTFRQY